MAEQKTVEQLSQDVETFKEDIRQLQKDLAEMLSSAGTYSRETLEEAHLRLHAAIAQLRYQAGQKASSMYESMRNQGAYAVDKSRRTIEQRPLTSIAVAFGAGVLLSWLSSRSD
ncbi:MAG: hypothetical protein LLF76_01430 [Planctomycetaceae bacterium]|nr:hypothetical protein [Planctomycetaceae bacterium]